MDKKYKKSELTVQTFGHGKNKMFIIFTDFVKDEKKGPRWYTRAYPDIEGNKAKATSQALKWLNSGQVPEPWVIKDSPVKFPLQYNQYGCPEYLYETDFNGSRLI